MKKILCLLTCLVLALCQAALSSCQWPIPTQTTATTAQVTESGTQATGTTAETTAGPTTAQAETTLATTTQATTTLVETTAETSATTTSAPEATPPATDPVPTNTASMYSSYALMESYNPANGWAEFDYFDMLRGDAAVQWLVNVEGYTLADAQEEVDNYADSEFIMKNVNPQLRTVDLTDLPLQLMYYPDGSMVEGATPVDAEISDLNALYALDPDLLLNSFFFYVTVSGGAVESVRQVYWP